MNAQEEARFISKIASMDDPVSCWEWTSAQDPDGYGRFWFRGHLARAHRLSAEYWGLMNIRGLQVCHSCDNPRCVNPAHLFPGTALDNAMDSNNKGRISKPFKPVSTPQGDYHSMTAAARALGVDWTTIEHRIRYAWPGYSYR